MATDNPKITKEFAHLGLAIRRLRDIPPGHVVAANVSAWLYIEVDREWIPVYTGDWIIRDLDREGYYPCTPEEFERKYQAVEEEVVIQSIIRWDRHDNINSAELEQALTRVSGGTIHCAMADTRMDNYALVIANRPLTTEEATIAFNQWFWDES